MERDGAARGAADQQSHEPAGMGPWLPRLLRFDGPLLVVEPSLSLARSILERVDLSDALARVSLLVGDDAAAVLRHFPRTMMQVHVVPPEALRLPATLLHALAGEPTEQPANRQPPGPGPVSEWPNAKSRVGHYGKTTLDLIEAAKAMREGEEKNILVVKLANLMKRHFLTWNRNTVEDSVIAAELKAKSDGKLTLPAGTELESQADILRSVRKTSDALARPHKKKKKRR